jgi:hypothetical protein
LSTRPPIGLHSMSDMLAALAAGSGGSLVAVREGAAVLALSPRWRWDDALSPPASARCARAAPPGPRRSGARRQRKALERPSRVERHKRAAQAFATTAAFIDQYMARWTGCTARPARRCTCGRAVRRRRSTCGWSAWTSACRRSAR